MSARVLYFGSDECQRLLVLRSAGYSIDECSSILKLRLAFDSGSQFSAVCMTDARAPAHREAISFVRAHPPTPLVLFQSSSYSRDESDFDLVIPNLTPPKEWLEKLAALVERSRDLNAESRLIHERSRLVVQEANLVRREAALARARAALNRARFHQILDSTPPVQKPIPIRPDPPPKIPYPLPANASLYDPRKIIPETISTNSATSKAYPCRLW